MIHNETSVEEVLAAVAREIASCETKDSQEAIARDFYEIMINEEFFPGGRILANARPGLSKENNYNNCFVIDIEDSIEGIYDAVKNAAIISKAGGGYGFNVSKLRPKDAPLSKGGVSSGAISFLKVFDASGKVISVAGQRRSACITILNIDHPDIEEFITVKQGDNNKALTQMNISVGITDKFIDAVKYDRNWDLQFNGKIYKTVKAKELYEKLTFNAYNTGDPGIFNLDNVNKESNSYYLGHIDSCNP
jgi:ribonucleoside-diphosphate reductase alpha chain